MGYYVWLVLRSRQIWRSGSVSCAQACAMRCIVHDITSIVQHECLSCALFLQLGWIRKRIRQHDAIQTAISICCHQNRKQKNVSGQEQEPAATLWIDAIIIVGCKNLEKLFQYFFPITLSHSHNDTCNNIKMENESTLRNIFPLNSMDSSVELWLLIEFDCVMWRRQFYVSCRPYDFFFHTYDMCALCGVEGNIDARSHTFRPHNDK